MKSRNFRKRKLRYLLRGCAGWRRQQKKECLNLTNKATMSLKIKEDENEQGRTKPIMSAGKPCKTQGHSADLKSLCDNRSTAILAGIGTGKMPVLRAADQCPNVDALVITQTLKVGATPKAFPTAGGPEPLAGASEPPRLTLIHQPPIMPWCPVSMPAGCFSFVPVGRTALGMRVRYQKRSS